MEKTESESKSRQINFDWLIHAEWLATAVILIISIFSMNSRFDAFMIAWHQESKDFHARLERQDLEFKSEIKRLESDYRNHLIYLHKENK